MAVGGLDGCMTRRLIDMAEALFDVQGRITDTILSTVPTKYTYVTANQLSTAGQLCIVHPEIRDSRFKISDFGLTKNGKR